MRTSAKSGQPHLVIAGILVPWESEFWDDVKAAWEISADLLSKEPVEIELHGWELYGGKGLWSNAPNPLPVIKQVFSALQKHSIPIYWVGLTIEKLKQIEDRHWERMLFAFLYLLNKKFSMSNLIPIEVCGDENTRVKSNYALTYNEWTAFKNRQVGFYNSSELSGIQIADIISHTIYRCNKSVLSNTDKTADQFRAQIATQIQHLS